MNLKFQFINLFLILKLSLQHFLLIATSNFAIVEEPLLKVKINNGFFSITFTFGILSNVYYATFKNHCLKFTMVEKPLLKVGINNNFLVLFLFFEFKQYLLCNI